MIILQEKYTKDNLLKPVEWKQAHVNGLKSRMDSLSEVLQYAEGNAYYRDAAEIQRCISNINFLTGLYPINVVCYVSPGLAAKRKAAAEVRRKAKHNNAMGNLESFFGVKK